VSNVAWQVRIFRALFACLLLPCLVQAEERWKLQFFYDQAGSVLQFNDLQCSSVERCMASGIIFGKNGREKGVIVLTSDGGQHWGVQEVAEHPRSLFLLNDSLGWMATDHGIWTTDDSGLTWKKQLPLKGILRVDFLNAEHGFAIGFPRAVYETIDGGKKWSKLAIAESQSAPAANIIYDCIAFSGDHGAILGRMAPQEDGRDPIWLNPNTARLQRQRDSSNIMLETFDAGKNWTASTNPVFGDVTELHITKGGFALALVEYHDYYSLASSVLKVDFHASKPLVVFAKRDRAVSDIAPLEDGGALLASIQPPGNSNQVPIPGKLRMLRSTDLSDWTEAEVDYRAVAQRAVVAAPDRNHAWVATDTGMILALTDLPASSR
jgi:Photosynthesis system II assembly factor YCF48